MSSGSCTSLSLVHVQVEVRTLGHQLEEVKRELSVEKSKCRLLEGVCGAGGGGNVEEKRGGRTGADQVATLEMKALNAAQRAELASVR